MVFDSPAALFWLIPLAGIIIVLYLMRMRRRDVRVPAIFLWPKLTSDVRANAPIQKLKWSLLLFLQLLIIGLVIFGLADPLHRARGLNGKATVVVLDASASMSATDVSPSRFESARQQVATLIGSMTTGDRLALIEAGSTTRVIFPLTDDRAKMRAALDKISATDAPNNMGEALRLAVALVGQRKDSGGRIVVLSDGAFPPITDFTTGSAEMVYQKLGETAHNVGVVAFDAADVPDGSTQLYAGLHNYGDAPVKTTLTFTLDGVVADAREVTVAAHQTVGQELKAAATARKAEVKAVTPGDVLKSDDHAILYLKGAGAVRTLLVTEGDLFLERSLALEPQIRLDKAPGVPDFEKAGAAGDGRYDLVIFDGVTPEAVKAPAVLSFGGVSSDMAVNDVSMSNSPRALVMKRDHPVMTHVDLTQVMIVKAHKVTAKPGGRVLVDGSDGPLVIASSKAGRRSVYVAWNLLDSDFPLQVSFPIFIDNTLAWLTGGGQSGGGGITIRAGQSFTIPAAGDSKTLQLKDPDGAKSDLDASSGIATVRSADRVGEYEITGGGRKTAIAVNLLDDKESDITPHPNLDLSGHPIVSKGGSLVLAETWRYLAALALLVMAVEWWVFVKRS